MWGRNVNGYEPHEHWTHEHYFCSLQVNNDTMRRRIATASIGLLAVSSAPHDVFSFLQQQLPNHYNNVASIRSRLYAQEPSTTSKTDSSSLDNDRPSRRKKQNKYANLSKADGLRHLPLFFCLQLPRSVEKIEGCHLSYEIICVFLWTYTC